ncbi:serine/threonine-protein kinase ULK1-like [Scleropages formosus]|uniref:non-specific serine/threonine protein kinase n=1 Tax=Scleropages formosus TaxID=113540 RepID=A0A0P7VIP7_SCLFO|nr:serine/threonine-protein kinase ULK1-like [Scleropages formosus]
MMKHDWEVAVKCINKKNLAKSQTLLGKEIKILKELKHENIVGLLDFQEMASCVYLVMEYCNGGDLADYLHSKGTLSEDTIRLFLQQIAGAMRVLQAKGIIHRDLKPQNILLSYSGGRKSNPNNTRIKIGERSPSGAPEVIMSQNYDAKADLWSIGTIVYQCLMGKAPFQASSPQDLRLFYEKNKNLSPNIPRETSAPLRHLLQGLLQRNHKDRMDFEEFFRHPFLEAGSSMKKSVPMPMPSYPSSASASSCSSSSTSHLASPPQSVAEMQQLRHKTLASPTQDAPGFLLKDSEGNSSSKNSSCDIDDFVMVPAQLPSEVTSDGPAGKAIQDSLMYSGSSLLISAGAPVTLAKGSSPSPSFSSSPGPPGSRLAEFPSSYDQSVPVPVPTQVHNYHRMEQNLLEPGAHGSPRAASLTHRRCCSGSLAFGRTGTSPPFPGDPGPVAGARRLSLGGSRPYQPSLQDARAAVLLEATHGCRQKIRKQNSDPLVQRCCGQAQYSSPKLSELIQRSPLPTILGSPTKTMPPFEFPKPPSSQNLVTLLTQQCLVLTPTRNRTVPDLKDLGPGAAACGAEGSQGAFGRSLSAGRLSDILLKAAFGTQLLDGGSNENLTGDKLMDTAAPLSGALAAGSGSPAPVVFTVGSPPSGCTPPQTQRTRMFSVGSSSSISSAGSFSGRQTLAGVYMDGCEGPPSPRFGFTDAVTANLEGAVTFEAPELPEETLMEMAGAKGSGLEVSVTPDAATAPDTSFLQPQQSLVADQISQLSREWSYAEQLVLYMKMAELLSSALQNAMDAIRQGKLFPSSTVKQVVKKLNELYKSSVSFCRGLSVRLQRFFVHKQRLMDRINSITAEKLIYSHTVQMVQSAALDEMFHHGASSVQRYHKALLLMEGLSHMVADQDDIHNLSKCKLCIERRLSALKSGLCA